MAAESVAIVHDPSMNPEPPAPPETGTGQSSPSPKLTRSALRARLATRHRRLEKCGMPLLALDLTIVEGRPVLDTVNGMSRGDPLYACVRDTLRGLDFPSTPSPQKFTVTLNLGSRVK